MRRLTLLGLMLAGPALAQSSVNTGALDTIRPTHAARAPRHAPAHHAGPAPSTAAVTKTAKPALQAAPPPIAALPPPVVVPVAKPPPPPPVPVVADAPGDATPLPTGLRVTFGADRADLNPTSVDAIRRFAAEVKPNEQISIDVLAFAGGGPDDPSTPRRVSLARALAARAVLISEGIPSTRIYPRALGTNAGDGPADRVDVVRAGNKP